MRSKTTKKYKKLAIIITTIQWIYCFMQQSKINSIKNENYQKAINLLINSEQTKILPRSPNKFNTQAYIKKGTTIFFMTLITVASLTQAVLTFDYVQMLTYLFTIVMGIIFGILQMKVANIPQQTEFLNYAQWYVTHLKGAENDRS